MFVSKVEKLLKSSKSENNGQNRVSLIFWFSLSLCFACFYIVLGIRQGFSSEYVIGDDAREYISWMYRYSNPKLFPNDLIADYFQSVTPIGYGAIYRLTMIAIDPIVLSKVLPILLVLTTTTYCFAVCMQILPVPIAGFLATLILNQSLCIHDDLFSACPRDFTYPLFLAFVYYLMRGSAPGIIIAFTIQALIYPLIAFIELGILFLRLGSFSNMRFRFSQQKQDYVLFGFVLAIALITITPYALQSSQFGPTITDAVARTMPDYFRGGRVSYYNDNVVSFWLDGRDSGLFALLNPVQILIGFLLPIVLIYRLKLPAQSKITNKVKVLLQVVLASTVMFFIAHALSFKLHFPSRYTHHTFKIVLAIGAGVVLSTLLDAALKWLKQTQSNKNTKRLLTYLAISIVGAALILYPTTLKTFPKTPYVVGSVPTLYKFLLAQPPDSLVASLAEEADNIPPFAKQPILVGKEYALPFHTKYYAQFSQRMTDLINAQYNQDIRQIVNFIDKYGVKYWLLERNAFQPEYVSKNTWIQQYQPAAKTASSKLSQESDFVLPKLIKSCTTLETENLFLLKAECIKTTKL
ncbi:hypothetical protein NIES4071_39120 [Calothrix sp. NIES-4071]|nr:hypothetical protein NIES4071_39120 [Calothrix sp. NIES-4071]BAZ58230.1 hypothetical protein NIES4105_39060 [Calothrix sp. NIES-4105]